MLIDKSWADDITVEIDLLATGEVFRSDSRRNSDNFAVGNQNVLLAQIVRGIYVSALKKRQIKNGTVHDSPF